MIFRVKAIINKHNSYIDISHRFLKESNKKRPLIVLEVLILKTSIKKYYLYI